MVWWFLRKIRPTQLWVELSWVVAIRLNDGNNNGQATHGARKPPGPTNFENVVNLSFLGGWGGGVVKTNFCMEGRGVSKFFLLASAEEREKERKLVLTTVSTVSTYACSKISFPGTLEVV